MKVVPDWGVKINDPGADRDKEGVKEGCEAVEFKVEPLFLAVPFELTYVQWKNIDREDGVIGKGSEGKKVRDRK